MRVVSLFPILVLILSVLIIWSFSIIAYITLQTAETLIPKSLDILTLDIGVLNTN